MSRVRTRPTRDETRDKLFEAAARVFEEQGIGGASVEAVAAAAGFTRGAFYSNFKSMDELIIAMLEDHVDRSIRRHHVQTDANRVGADAISACFGRSGIHIRSLSALRAIVYSLSIWLFAIVVER